MAASVVAGARVNRRGLLFIVSAPSGAGKTTLVRRLVRRVPRMVISRSYTSRAVRPGEVDGVDYNFVEAARFRDMVAAGTFLEWAEVFGRLYGTSAADTERHRAAGRDVVLVIDVQGARQVREKGVDAVGIFLLPPSFQALEARLRRRSGGHVPEADLQRRLVTARREVEMSADYDYVVVNDDVEAGVGRLRHIVLAERSAVRAMRDTTRAIAGTFNGVERPDPARRPGAD